MKNQLILLCSILLINTCIKAQCWDTLSSGNAHSLGIKTDGTLWAWGNNNDGALGDGTLIEKHIPMQIGTSSNWKQISSGANYNLAVKIDGTLWAWGDNLYGQLGDGTTVDKLIPIQIGTATNWKQISTAEGGAHSMAIKTDGSLWAWGWNGFGQLGDGTTINKNVPTQIGTDTNWKIVLAGSTYNLAIKTDGTLWTWGDNTYGQLGDGTTTNKNLPTQLGVATNWKQIATGGDYHNLAIKTNGSLWGWGQNIHGQLGDGTTINKLIPTQIGADTDWEYTATGRFQGFAIKTSGTLWSWGWNDAGQLGDGTLVDKSSPNQIGISTNWKKISGGGSHSLCKKLDGSLWTFGLNFNGQLGDGTTTNKNIPTLIGATCLAACLPGIVITSAASTTVCSGMAVSFTATITDGGISPAYQWKRNGVNVGTGLNTYSLSTLANGDIVQCMLTSNATCASTSTVMSNSISFTVNPLPVVTVNSGTICSGSPFLINPTGANTYTISGGSFNVSPTTTTSYSITGTSAQGCVNSNAVVSTVSVSAKPTVSVNIGAICSGKSFTIVPGGASTYTITGGSFNVSPTATTNYSVTGTSAQGCMSSNVAVSTVSVNALPAISVNSGAICSGKTFTINPTGANTYTITGGSFNVSPTATASYSVTGTSAQGCVSSNAVVSTVSVNALPLINASGSNSIICVGELVTLTANGGTSYVWSTGATSASIAVSPSATTNYTVTGTGSNGCSSTAIITQSVNLCTGIESLNNTKAFIVYPNPTSGIITLKLSSDAQVIITNDMGQQLFNQSFTQNEHSIDLSHVATGMYIVTVVCKDQHQFFKLVKQ